MTDILIIILTGMIAGFIGGYGAIGGGVIMIFIMTTMLSMSQHQAQGTVLAMFIGPMSLMGVILLRDKVKKYIKEVIIAVLTYVSFSYIGAYTAYLFSSKELKFIFAFILIIMGVFYIASSFYNLDLKNPRKLTNFSMFWIGALAGYLGGLIGIGGGIILVPSLCIFYGFDKNDARAISLATLLPPVSLGGVIQYSNHNDINWKVAIILFISFFAMNYFGTKLANKHSIKQFKLYFGFLLILIALMNLYLMYTQ